MHVEFTLDDMACVSCLTIHEKASHIILLNTSLKYYSVSLFVTD